MHFPALFQFLEGLHESNARPWFLHNKPQYDILNEEFLAFTGEVAGQVAKFVPEMAGFEVKKAVYRIYRDVRFAKDKTPYKTHFGACLPARNTGDKSQPIYYFQIDHTRTLLIAAGIYMPDNVVLKKIRDHIVAEPKAFAKLLNNKAVNGAFGGLSPEGRMTRPPKGYASDLPHIDFIKNRHFFCETTIDLSKRIPKNLSNEIATAFKSATPLCDWLRSATR